jgi:hypothetical protein
MATGHERADGSGRRDKPTSARAYGWMLGGEDNEVIDREFILAVLQGFPECVDIARQNRQFLYRAVRYLARDAGIDQFIDAGSAHRAHRRSHHGPADALPLSLLFNQVALVCGPGRSWVKPLVDHSSCLGKKITTKGFS